MTDVREGPRGEVGRHLSPRWLASLSWAGGAYFLGAVFVSIAHQLFFRPPAATSPPSAYHRSWCAAQLTGLRTELETQARGALAGGPFAPPRSGEREGWYARWQSWHGRVAAACPASAGSPTQVALHDLAGLAESLARQCAAVAGPARAHLEAIDRTLVEVRREAVAGGPS